jgi:hypothetical protein
MFAIEEDLHLATHLGDFISLGLQLVAINILIVNVFWSTSKEQESLGCTHRGNGIVLILDRQRYDRFQLPFLRTILQRRMVESKGAVLTDKRDIVSVQTLQVLSKQLLIS